MKTLYIVFHLEWLPTGANAIICKFVLRLAKESVLATRRNVNGLSAVDLSLNRDAHVSHINLYDHLTEVERAALSLKKSSRMLTPTSMAGRRMDLSFRGRQITPLH